jgi:oligopeptide/dipeptide ABC transporter ATP-binding protein
VRPSPIPISHDLSVVGRISDYVGVMYLGKIVESGRTAEVYNNPLHPYTQALLSAVPVANPNHQCKRIILKGDIPSPILIPAGCYFHTRCRFAQKVCSHDEPPLISVANDHQVACHLHTL